MENIITQKELVDELNNFRFVLQNFDYSDIKNVIFINIEALYSYIEAVENNPFNLQYEQLQKILDIIEPYIPFITENGFLNIIDITEGLDDLKGFENIQKSFSSEKRLNFANIVRNINTNDDWEYIIDICKDIHNNYKNSNILS